MIPFPNKKYNILYPDPPWSYQDKANAGKRGAVHKYNLMSDEQIKALPVYDIAETNSILFMWATWPKMETALEVIKAWGFIYKTIGFIWIKTNPVSGTHFMGMGNWTRSNSEPCLLAIKGKTKRIDAGVLSVIESPRLKHSEKPPEVRDKIVKLVGNLPRIELFARQQISGWDFWGDELNGGKKGVTKEVIPEKKKKVGLF